MAQNLEKVLVWITVRRDSRKESILGFKAQASGARLLAYGLIVSAGRGKGRDSC